MGEIQKQCNSIILVCNRTKFAKKSKLACNFEKLKNLLDKDKMHVLQNANFFIFVDCLDFFALGLDCQSFFIQMPEFPCCFFALSRIESPPILTLDRDELEGVCVILNGHTLFPLFVHLHISPSPRAKVQHLT